MLSLRRMTAVKVACVGFSLYMFSHPDSERYYLGITKNFKQRLSAHKHHSKVATHTPLYAWVGKYGWDNVCKEVLYIYEEKDLCGLAEQVCISCLTALGEPLLNLHEGGYTGYIVDPEKHPMWIPRLREARKGNKPALGMMHTEENKKLFREVSNAYWATQDTYDPVEVTSYSFKDASRIFGISKTHYYRLKKRVL